MAAPNIISNGGGDTASVSVAENTDFVTSIETDESVDSIDITGGADAAFFSISAPDLLFLSPPDFETPADADLDNVYEVEITVTNVDGSDSQLISVTVTDVDEGPPSDHQRGRKFAILSILGILD